MKKIYIYKRKWRWPRWTCIILCVFVEHSEWWHCRFSLPSVQICPHNPCSLLSGGFPLPISDSLGRVHKWEVVSKKRLQRFDGTLRKLLTAQLSWQDRYATDRVIRHSWRVWISCNSKRLENLAETTSCS